MEDEVIPQKPDTPEIKEAKDDLDRAKAIAAVMNQEGGKLLLGALREDILSDVESLISLFKAPETELRVAVLKLRADLNMYRVLKRASESATLIEEALSKLLEENV